MTIGFVLFGAVQLLLTIYAFWCGGWPERAAAVITTIAWFAGWISPFDPHTGYRAVDTDILVIDTLLAAALILIALNADRYWPIWASTLQVLVIGFHGVRWYDPTLLPIAYHHLIVWLAYLLLAGIAVGIWRHDRRCRQRAGPADR